MSSIGFLNQGEGQFTPWVRWGAKKCMWEKSGDGQGSKDEFQFTQAIFDLENLRVGWACIQTGQAPQWVFADNLSQNIPQPEGKDDNGKPLFKRGFSVKVMSKSMFGDEPVREFATNQMGSIEAIKNLYDEYKKQAGNNPGMVPVVEFKGHKYEGMGSNGTNVPQLAIVKWVPRPAELGTAQATQPAAAPAPQQVASAQSSVSEF